MVIHPLHNPSLLRILFLDILRPALSGPGVLAESHTHVSGRGPDGEMFTFVCNMQREPARAHILCPGLKITQLIQIEQFISI